MKTRSERMRERAARALISVYLFAALLAAMLWLVELVPRRRISPPEFIFGALNVPLTQSLVSVVILSLVSAALLTRKRPALLTVGVFQLAGGVLSVLDLIRWIDRPGIVPRHVAPWVIAAEQVGLILISIAGVALVWWLRPAFPARPVHGSWTRATLVLVGGAATSLLVTRLLLAAFREAGDDWIVLRLAFLRAFGLHGWEAPDSFDAPMWIPQVTAVLLSVTIIGTVWVFLRSARPEHAWTPGQELALRQLLAADPAPDSLSYFATRRDRSAIFADDGSAAVTYRVLNSVCLAAGDPVGPRSSWPVAIAGWLAQARSNGWTPAVLTAGEDAAREYVKAGLNVLRRGDEAVLDPGRCTLASTSMTSVRHAVAHARRAGVSVQVRRHGDLPPAELAGLVADADAWRHGEDRGFSMALNREADPADGECLMVSAHQDGTPVALLSFVPWGRRGLSLDVMRRAPQAPSGCTELMVAELMTWADANGVREVSLNFAMFREVFASAERLGAGTVKRLQSSVLGFLDRFWQLQRLYRSNEKYRPAWVTRYLCFDQHLALPLIAVAAGRAEGFLPDPFVKEPTGRLDEHQLAAVAQLRTAPLQAVPAPRLTASTRDRITHLDRLADAGRPGWPIGLAPAASVAGLSPAPWQGRVRVFGRVRHLRRHGGVVFVDLTDAGRSVQVAVERERVGPDALRELSGVDLGDIVVVDGDLGRTRNGTEAVLADSWELASKALRPVPFDGFTDPRLRRRHRQTDLLVHPEAMTRLLQRSAIVRATRGFFDGHGFTEVETPILATVHGGATARPFRTYINAYGADLTLRIAPELQLKRLLVAGSGAIYEIGRNFRNEGADATHNPEFTSLEAYLPFADYHDMRRLTEALILHLAEQTHGRPQLMLPDPATGQPRLTDVPGPWPVVSVLDAVSKAVGRDVDLDTDFEELVRLARDHQVPLHDGMGPGAVIEELYGELVESATHTPTFYVDFPEETSPLTGPHRTRPGLVERWDLVAGGVELGTAYSELADPLIQRRRLTEQSLKAAAGDPEAMQVDEEFLFALETGMPPAGGLGIGVDRLVMALIGGQIRDVLTFPFVKPERDG